MTAPAVVAVTSGTWTSVGTGVYFIQAVALSSLDNSTFEVNPIYVTISATAPNATTDFGVIVYPQNDIRAPNYPFSCPAGQTLYVRAVSSEGGAFIAIPLAAGGLISGTGLPALGQAAMTASLPVTMANNQSTIPVLPLPRWGAYNNSAGTTGYQVVSGSGIFHGITVNTAGTTTTATFYDGTSTGGTKLATVDTTSKVSLSYDVGFITGLFVVLTVANAADVTIMSYADST